MISAFGIEHGEITKAARLTRAGIQQAAQATRGRTKDFLGTGQIHNAARQVHAGNPNMQYVNERHLENVNQGTKKLRRRSLAVGGAGGATVAGGGGYAAYQQKRKS